MKKIILLIVISVFSISCSENKIKLSTEDLNNCAKWNWIALSDTKLWTAKAEAYFTYVPGEKIIKKELTDEELLLCGTWQSVYTSSYFSDITKPYKNQYENADVKGELFFCKDVTGYVKNKIFSKKNNIVFYYIFNFEWNLNKNNLFIIPLSIQELEKDSKDIKNIIQTYEYTSKNEYCIGSINIDKKYLIQTKNWNFQKIPVTDSFIYKRYGIKEIGNDCIRYKYTWIEDWGEPILRDYIKANDAYSLDELESMSFYK